MDIWVHHSFEDYARTSINLISAQLERTLPLPLAGAGEHPCLSNKIVIKLATGAPPGGPVTGAGTRGGGIRVTTFSLVALNRRLRLEAHIPRLCPSRDSDVENLGILHTGGGSWSLYVWRVNSNICKSPRSCERESRDSMQSSYTPLSTNDFTFGRSNLGTDAGKSFSISGHSA